ncbi:exodeoxyribonuclease VII small subunit, partial [Staphylococcus saprophyticus]
MSKEKQSFEEMMQELESIVQKLDNENVSLESLYYKHIRSNETLMNIE